MSISPTRSRLPGEQTTDRPLRRPDWIKVGTLSGDTYAQLQTLMRSKELHTVCEEAACPNMGECWNHRTATFMILGNFCTRRCGFCAVQKGAPLEVDYDEPRRVAEACAALNLRYVVITSVNRDDRADGGARIFALTIQTIRERIPGCRVEVLIPDFQGDEAALRTVIEAAPDVLNHNIETVPRLYKEVRMGARYERSLELLARASAMNPAIPTKSGLMVGLGESNEEVLQTLEDMRAHGVAIATIGQYLRPTTMNLPVLRYVAPAEFAEFKRAGMRMGFSHVESGPLVRSSYHAHDAVPI